MQPLAHLFTRDALPLGLCLAATFAASVKLEHAVLPNGQTDRFKINFASLTLGFGVWASQLIGALGDNALAPTGFAPWALGLSLTLSLAGCAVGLRLWARADATRDRVVAGGLIGTTFLLAHALNLVAADGLLLAINPWLAGGGALLTLALAGAASLVERGRGLRGPTIRAGLLMACAVLVHLLGGWAFGPAAPLRQASTNIGLSNIVVSQLVALVSAMVLMMSLWAVSRETRRRVLDAEAQHLRTLADAVLEGLVIVDQGQILASNRAFDALIGRPARQLDEVFATDVISGLELNTPLETELLAAGAAMPVEIVASTIRYKGADRRAIAVRDLRSRRQAEDQIRYLAHNDTLTGLLNRASFLQRLEMDLMRLRRSDDRLAVLFLDLDRFKQVNDVMGHAAGDAVLREVAARIQARLGPGDSFARLGGDEFAIIRTEALSLEGLDGLCSAILAAIAPPINVSLGRTAMVGSSIGVALFPNDGVTAPDLLAAADAALYQAKAAGRNTYRFFDAAMANTLKARQALEQELRQALGRDQLRLVYQPQARISDNVVDGFEALVRWDHPIEGAIPPDRFIPIAEESGLILELGEWVLRNACAQATSWKGGETLSVNVSAVQLHHNGLPDLVHLILLETGLSPARLELEITETALIKNAPQALHVLRRLKALGVRIAMDDFGTGFSSLSNLRNFPIDTIKIDGSFVHGVDHDPQSATIVRAVLGLGGGLGMKVIAEGVETRAEESFLVAEGCVFAQGYLYGSPAKQPAQPPAKVRAHG